MSELVSEVALIAEVPESAARDAIAAVFDWLEARKLDGVHDPYWASEYWQGQLAEMRKTALG